MLAKFIAVDDMASKAMQKVTEEVVVFDGLAGLRGLVYNSPQHIPHQAQAQFVQDFVSLKTKKRKKKSFNLLFLY